MKKLFKAILLILLTVFFILFGLDFLKWNINFGFNWLLKVDFDISSLSKEKYSIQSSLTQEQKDIMTRRPLKVWLEVSFPELEKEK